MGKTAEEMNKERRAAKARQKAVAKARTANRKNQETPERMSLSDIVRENKIRERKERLKQQAQADIQRLADEAFAKLLRLGSFMSYRQHFGSNVEQDAMWDQITREVIRKAKAHSKQFSWLGNWQVTGVFTIAIVKS